MHIAVNENDDKHKSRVYLLAIVVPEINQCIDLWSDDIKCEMRLLQQKGLSVTPHSVTFTLSQKYLANKMAEYMYSTMGATAVRYISLQCETWKLVVKVKQYSTLNLRFSYRVGGQKSHCPDFGK